MNEQDIINLILGEPDGDFHGTVPSEGKRQQFDRLRGHAGALMRHTHGSLTIVIALPWKMLCANFILPCGENHYGFFLRCPTSFYNRPKNIIFICPPALKQKRSTTIISDRAS